MSDTPAADELLASVQDGVATLTINRPERRNALDAEHYAAISEAWIRVRDDPEVRAAIITGAGDKAFCAGADIKSYIGRKVEPSELWLTQKGQLLNRGLEELIRQCPAQYLWGYNRYKVPAGAEPPPTGAPA